MRAIDVACTYAFIGSMGNVIKKAGRNRTRPLTINVSDDYKDKYDRLSVERKVRVSEHLRLVVYPELDRLWSLEMGPQSVGEPPDAA